VINSQRFETLRRTVDQGPCISMYLPTLRGGPEVRQAAIRLKNLLQEAESRLQDAGFNETEITNLLAPARELVGNQSFWEHQRDGLAIFIGPDGMDTFRCARHFDELCYVNRHFHLKPLLPILGRKAHFRLLALSLNQVRLYEVDPVEMSEVQPCPLPTSLADALGHDLTSPTLQHHVAGGGRGADRTVFHGQGAGDDDRTAEVVRFMQIIDQALRENLDDPTDPVVVAGVEEHVHRFHELSRHHGLVPGGVMGNPDSLDRRRLHAEAWDLARPVLEADEERAADRYMEWKGTDMASARIGVVGRALAAGRVESLLVATDQEYWGEVNEDGTPHVHDHRAAVSVDVLDRLAMMGLERGAQVVARRATRLPDGVALAAVMRY